MGAAAELATPGAAAGSRDPAGGKEAQPAHAQAQQAQQARGQAQQGRGRRGLRDLDPPLLCLLRMGLYELTEMGKPPHTVNGYVELAKSCLHTGAGGFVNGEQCVGLALGPMG